MKIFIVDDDPIQHKIAIAVFNRFKLDDYISYTNPVNALIDLAEAHYSNRELPDLIILDLEMPEMTGWEFVESFNKISLAGKHNTRVHIVSSSLVDSDQEKLKLYSCLKGLHNKPLSDTIFDTIVEEVA